VGGLGKGCGGAEAARRSLSTMDPIRVANGVAWSFAGFKVTAGTRRAAAACLEHTGGTRTELSRRMLKAAVFINIR